MKIGIISDIHDNLRAADKALKALSSRNVELLINCGDFTSPFTMRIFANVKVLVRSVLGNGDPDIEKFQYQLQNLDILKNLKLDIQPILQDFKVDGKRIAVVHGDDENLIKFLIESQKFDLFCRGHNHQPDIKQVGKTLIVNPGSLVGFMIEKGAMSRTVAVYDTLKDRAELIDIDE